MISLVDSVEFVEMSLAGSTGTTTSGMLTKGQNIENCVPFMGHYCANTSWDGQFTDYWFTDEGGPAINARRHVANSNTMTIKGYVVEFDPEKVKVYQGDLPTTVNYNAETSVTVTASGTFDQSRTAMIFYYRVANTPNVDYPAQMLVRGRVNSDGTTVSFRKQINVSNNHYGHYYLFESIDDDFSVHHRASTFTSNTSYETGVYDWHNTFVLGSYASDYNGTGTDYSCARGYLWGNSRVGLNRQSNSGTIYYSYQKIEFDNDATASGTRYCPKITSYHSMGTTTTVRDIDHNPSDQIVNSDGLMVALVQNPTRAAYTTQTDCGGAWHAVWTTNSGSSYRIQRGDSVYAAYPTYHIIDWEGNQVPQYPDLGHNPAPLASGVTPVKSTEYISTTIPEHVSTVTLTKGQDVSNCIVFKTGWANRTSAYNVQYYHEFMTYFRGNQLFLERGNESVTHYSELHVVEFYPDQVKVQQGFFTIGMNATSTTVTIEAIDTSKTFLVFGHFFGDGADEWSYHLVRGRITNSTTLTFSRGMAHTYPIMGSWYIAEDLEDYWNVRHWNSSSATTNRLTPQWDQHYNEYNTFNLMSSEMASAIDDPDEATWQCYYHSPLSPARGEKVGSSYANTVNFQVINFVNEDRARVQYYNRYITGTASESTWDLPSQMATSSGVTPIWNNLNGIARVSYTSESTNIHAFHRLQYDKENNQITASRRYANISDTSGGSTYTIDWEGYTKSSGDYDYTQLGHFIKSIEHHTFEGNMRRRTWTLTKGQDMDNCIPIGTWLQSEDSGQDPERFSWAFWFWPEINSVSMSAYWNPDNPGIDMDIAIVEFDPAQVRVQRGTAHIHSGSTTDTVTIEEVDTSKAFVMVYMFPADSVGANWGAVHTSVNFSSSTELFFQRNQSTANMHLTWFVVECLQDQWSVEHRSLTNSNQTYYHFDFSNYSPPDKTISVASYSSAYTSDDPDHNFYRMYPSYDRRGVHRISVNRQASGYNTTMHCSKIAFAENSGVTVTTLHYYFGTTETTKTYSIGRTVDPNKTIVFNGLALNTMRTNSTSYTATQRSFIKSTIQDPETLLVERSSDPVSVEGWGHVYIIEFDFPTHKIAGVVREKGDFVSRDLHVHRTDTGELLGSTTSSGLDGTYEVVTSYSGSTYVVCFDDVAGTVYNGLIETDVYPVAVLGTFPYEEGWV